MDMLDLLTGPITSDALISPCGKYRYWLTRRWGQGKLLPYIMLNPSTADALKDDQTVRRCMFFARRLGYDGILVLNLYAFRATQPKDLEAAAAAGVNVVGPENLRWVEELTKDSMEVVLAWGGMTFKEMDHHGEVILATLSALPRDVTYLCLGATANESPRHPSRLGNEARFEEYLPGIEWLPEDSSVRRKILGA
jgi:hypothetical protein